MIKKTVTFTDYNDVEKTQDYYFNLNQAEIMEMELSSAGGMSETIQNVIKSNDTSTLIAIFKDLLLKSYGKKTPEGRFEKSEALRREFESSAAYPILFVELATDADAASKFMNGVIPANLNGDSNNKKAKKAIEASK